MLTCLQGSLFCCRMRPRILATLKSMSRFSQPVCSAVSQGWSQRLLLLALMAMEMSSAQAKPVDLICTLLQQDSFDVPQAFVDIRLDVSTLQASAYVPVTGVRTTLAMQLQGDQVILRDQALQSTHGAIDRNYRIERISGRIVHSGAGPDGTYGTLASGQCSNAGFLKLDRVF